MAKLIQLCKVSLGSSSAHWKSFLEACVCDFHPHLRFPSRALPVACSFPSPVRLRGFTRENFPLRIQLRGATAPAKGSRVTSDPHLLGTQFIVGRCPAVCRWYRGLGHLDLDHQSWMDAAGTWWFSERASQPLQNPWTLANVPIPGGQARPSDR